MHPQQEQEPKVTGHLSFSDADEQPGTLSTYALEEMDYRARAGIRRWFKIGPREVSVYSEEGFVSHETFKEDLEDFLSVVRNDNTYAHGEIVIIHPGKQQNVRYLIKNNEVSVTY
jgi:hypothetical protein